MPSAGPRHPVPHDERALGVAAERRGDRRATRAQRPPDHLGPDLFGILGPENTTITALSMVVDPEGTLTGPVTATDPGGQVQADGFGSGSMTASFLVDGPPCRSIEILADPIAATTPPARVASPPR